MVPNESWGPPIELWMTPKEAGATELSALPFVLARQADLQPYHYVRVFDR